jgi:predicted N-acetyltransferase YhbS
MTPTTTQHDPAAGVVLRAAEPEDRDEVGRIIYEAFARIDDQHGFARDFPTRAVAEGVATGCIAHPQIWGVVAEIDGRVVGSNFLDERGPIRGIGPITVDPAAQGRRVGRRLMEAVIERGRAGSGVRLLQDAFNTSSLSLYASLGFEIRDPVVAMGGRPRDAAPADVAVRPLDEGDLEECSRLHRAVHGYEREQELRDALESPRLEPFVAVRGTRIVAYASTLTSFGTAHAVAQSEEDLLALILGILAATDADASFLLPTRQGRLFRACLATGLRVVKPMTYMTIGDYREPRGAWLPSVLY